jgi:hypothetical protein
LFDAIFTLSFLIIQQAFTLKVQMVKLSQ